MAWIFGVIAGIVGIVAYVPYIRDILARRTQPERASWLIWSIEYCALFVAQASQGATDSLWLIGLQLLGVVAICALSMRYGAGKFTRRDYLLLACACVTIAAWYFTDNASMAIILLISVETVAVLPTIIKTYRQPESETLSTWALIGTAGILALPAVGSGSAILYLYPASLVVINFGVVAAAMLGAKALRSKQVTQPE